MTGKKFLGVAALTLAAANVFALQPTAAELKTAREWVKTAFVGEMKDLPFTFVYDGKKFPGEGWTRISTASGFALKAPDGAVEVTCELNVYPDFPAASWLLRFKNVSAKRSKVISAIKPFDFRIPVKSKKKLHVVHHASCAMQSLNDYQQFETVISQDWWRKNNLKLTTAGGRACQAGWPYFNVETPDAKAGMIAAIGWPGQWEAFFDAMGDDRVKITAGQTDCRFYLEPGEEVRVPRAMVILYLRDDWTAAQNLWRAWFLKYNAPRCNGEIVTHHTSASLAGAGFDSDQLNAKNMVKRIDEYFDHGLPFDYWWIDAAWYEWKSQWNETDKKPHWRWTGNWEPDPVRFPNGPGEAFRHALKRGAKGGILWFEIERVVRSAKITTEHPEYLYPEYHPDWYRGNCLNLGSEGGWKWAFDTVNGTMKREDANFLRLDFNLSPLDIWRNADARDGEKNRCGISEMKHVEGFHRLYAEILKADPSRRIDNCAQGGTRNDYETLSYSVPLWRTDTSSPINEQQMQTLGISLWIPLYGGGGLKNTSKFELRSRMQPYFLISYKSATEGDWRELKAAVAEWKKYLVPYYTNDFYPLTRSDAGTDLWTAWEFVDAEKGEGVVQAFRRENTRYPAFVVKPKGLDAAKRYTFEDIDTHETWTIPGDGEFEIRAELKSAKIISFKPATGDANAVPILNDAMHAFLSRPRWERMGLLLDDAFRAAACKAGSNPKPYEIKIAGADDATVIELSKSPAKGAVRNVKVKNGIVRIDNLEVATRYAWRAVKGGNTIAKGAFATEDGVPRVCRIDGVGNVRDFGGRVTKDGKRIRQGLVYRSAAFNRTAFTPKGKDKSQWKPGATFLSDETRREALETFGFKTDLDFRNEEETFGITGSPLGKDVQWTDIVSSNYDDMKNPGPKAAFAKDFRLLLDPNNLPLVFHCAGGADRTGTFAWLIGGILGEKEDDLYKDWELTVFNYDAMKFNHWNFIGELVRMLDAKYPGLSPQEQCVAYAKDCGISNNEIARFRALMLQRD